MEASIGELNLTVRAPPDAVPSAPDVERFACRVLEAVAERVEGRWPGRVVLIRELVMSWRIPASGIDEEAEAEAIASEIVETFAEEVDREPKEPDASGTFTWFQDEAAYLAAYLDALSSSGGATQWHFAPAAAQAPGTWSDGVMLTALGRLWRGGRLPAIVAALPAVWVARAAAATGVADITSGSAGVTVPPAAMIAVARQLPVSLDEPGARLCLSVAAVSLLPNASQAERAAVVSAVLPLSRPAPNATLDERGAAGRGETVPEPVADHCVTEWGGAAYLLTAAMELGLGEILWRACLPEGVVFSSALGVLLGAEGANDPMISLLGASGDAATELSEAQQEEVSLELLSAFLSSNESRDSAPPSVRLGLRHRGGDRFLVACMGDGGYPCFAWPAVTTAQLSRGMAVFLDRWPCHLRKPEASPGLAVLDAHGRTVLTFDGQLPDSLPIPASGGAPRAALLSQIAGTLGAVWSARLGLPGLEPSALRARYFRIPGRVYRSPEWLDVVLPMERIDIDVRRAGLDRDPGWVPWLERVVRVEFQEPTT